MDVYQSRRSNVGSLDFIMVTLLLMSEMELPEILPTTTPPPAANPCLVLPRIITSFHGGLSAVRCALTINKDSLQ